MPENRSLRITTSIGRFARRIAAAKGGNAAVEFGLIAPVLLGLLVPVADYGVYIYDDMQLHLAAQAGMEYAAHFGYDPTGITNATINAATPLDLTANDVTVTQFCGCPDANYNVVVTPNCSGNTVPRPHCNNDPAQPIVGVYVNVTATYQYHTLVNYPGTPPSQTISSGATSAFRWQ
jgi:Flp pilus assembly protein TadG